MSCQWEEFVKFPRSEGEV